MRKHTKRKVYPPQNPIAIAMRGASIVTGEELQRLRSAQSAAVEAFMRGSANNTHWAEAADMVNVSYIMASKMGIGPEALPACEAASHALAAAIERRNRTGKLGMTGPDLVALRDVYEYHDLQRGSVASSVYSEAWTKTSRWIQNHPKDQKVSA